MKRSLYIGFIGMFLLFNLSFGQFCGDPIDINSIDEICNLTDLTEINLYDSGLTGEIPSCIGNLTNLTCLDLYDNQLNGEIPESICDLNIEWSSSWSFNISNNQLCPPYPSCIEDDVGNQDTSDCP